MRSATARRQIQGRQGDDRAWLEGRLYRVGRGRLERSCGDAGLGGQGLPIAVNAACIEMWNSASMAFASVRCSPCGAIEASTAHGATELKDRYLPKDDLRRMDRHDEAHRAAGGLRRRRAAHERRAQPATAPIAFPGRRSSSPTASTISPTTSCTSCWRGSRCAAGQSRHLAVPRSQIPVRTRTARSASATTSAVMRSSTSSASTARRPARW